MQRSGRVQESTDEDVYLSIHLRLCCLVAHLVIRGSEPDLRISGLIVVVLVLLVLYDYGGSQQGLQKKLLIVFMP